MNGEHEGSELRPTPRRAKGASPGSEEILGTNTQGSPLGTRDWGLECRSTPTQTLTRAGGAGELEALRIPPPPHPGLAPGSSSSSSYHWSLQLG